MEHFSVNWQVKLGRAVALFLSVPLRPSQGFQLNLVDLLFKIIIGNIKAKIKTCFLLSTSIINTSKNTEATSIYHS